MASPRFTQILHSHRGIPSLLGNNWAQCHEPRSKHSPNTHIDPSVFEFATITGVEWSNSKLLTGSLQEFGSWVAFTLSGSFSSAKFAACGSVNARPSRVPNVANHRRALGQALDALVQSGILRRTGDLTPDEGYQILGEIEAEMRASNEGNAERCWELSVVS